MKLQILHRTSYRYESMVAGSYNDVRLRPVNRDVQKRLSFELRIEPRVAITDYKDFYGNAVCAFEVSEEHQSLVVEANSLVETFFDKRGEPSADTSSYCLDEEQDYGIIFDFLLESKFINLYNPLWDVAKKIRTAGPQNAWSIAQEIARWVSDEFTYDKDATEVHTSSHECLRMKRGVCQDFAHVMIGLCRKQKIAARYVSGYLFQDNDQSVVEVQRASHAWVEVYLSGYGWKGIDPTHNCCVDEYYVKLAIGRDYADVRPVSGTYFGAPSKSLDVFLQINQVD